MLKGCNGLVGKLCRWGLTALYSRKVKTMLDKDTAYNDYKNPDFVATDLKVTWAKEKGEQGINHWSILYKPTLDCVQWDIPDFEDAYDDIYAIGSRFGVYAYVIVKRTGRKVVEIPHADKLWGVRVQLIAGLQSDDLQSWSAFVTPADYKDNGYDMDIESLPFSKKNSMKKFHIIK